VKITVVFPAYNEEQDLPPLLARTGEALLAAECDFRVLVVDDGSEDSTAEVAEGFARQFPLTLIRHPRNMGLGAAIRTGLRAAAKEGGAVITMDADNSHDPALIPALVERLGEGFDVVIASRFQEGGEEVGVAPHRVLLSHTASRVMRLAVGFSGVRDYTCGYRAYTAEVLRELQNVYGDDFVGEDGFACMFELLVKLKAIGARASEVPLVLRYDMKTGASKMRVFRTMGRYAAVLWNGYVSKPAAGAGRFRETGE